MDSASLGVSRETFERLEIYQQLLIRWQKKINLVSPSSLDHFWSRHVKDSLQCLAIRPNVEDWVDIGSGGGFPGMVIAIVLAEKSRGRIQLVECNHKKAAFLRTVIRETGACAKVLATRAEDIVGMENAPEIVCARAVMSLAGLLDLCSPWLTKDTTALFHKGRNYRGELEETHDKWQYDLLEHASNVVEDSVLLEISNLRHAAENI